MTVCAIVAARIRDGAQGYTAPADSPASEVFARAASRAFPSSLTHAVGFECLRAKALLAILYIQYADVTAHRAHLSEYVALCTDMDFYDEAKWAVGMGPPELEERRRVVSA